MQKINKCALMHKAAQFLNQCNIRDRTSNKKNSDDFGIGVPKIFLVSSASGGIPDTIGCV